MAKQGAFFMNTIWAVIPVKPLVNTKTRLASVLSPQERTALTMQLFVRLICEVKQVARIAETVVVTRDERLAALACAFGTHRTAEAAEEGLNEAVARGVRLAGQRGATHALILPSDLPLVTRADLDRLLEKVADTAVSICSDEKALGTNALLVPVGAKFRFAYGVNSLEQHIAEAERAGLLVQRLYNDNLQFDIDTANDWEQYQILRLKETLRKR